MTETLTSPDVHLRDTGFTEPPAEGEGSSSDGGDDDAELPPLEDVERREHSTDDREDRTDDHASDQNEEETRREAGGDAEDAPRLTKEARRELYLKAKELEEKEETEQALDTYFKCLRGVQPDTAFPELPTCLRAVAEIYYKKEEYQKAVHFIQAEKLYYEAALLDTSVLQKLLDDGFKKSDSSEVTEDLQILRANEYETLSRYCLDKKELPLALEYAAKAAKLREMALGDEHPETTKSLDYVTMVYAELGKQEYAESLEKFDSVSKNSDPAQAQNSETSASDPASRNSPQNSSLRASVGQRQHPDRAEREIRISLIFFSLMVFITFAVLTFVCFYAYCKYLSTETCNVLSRYIRQHLDWLRYQFHVWMMVPYGE